MRKKTQFDVIVVGGGHAGIEAAAASARIGANTLLITHNIDTLGQMSCNPAIGGIGKGHLVKEVDALGGLMAQAIDQAGIQFRTLNARKGPAVRATRAQADRSLYKSAIRRLLEQQTNLTIFQAAVDDINIKKNTVTGIVTQTGITFSASSVVLTVGTFLGGCIHTGLKQSAGGRSGDPPAIALAQRMRALPFRVDRLKTGTPPRIDSRSINYQSLEAQSGDQPIPVFSFMGKATDHPQQVNCHITYTNPTTHQIIADNLHQSPMFSGDIEGVGPRYCPSIEDKIHRFADKDQHQIFIEPEGLDRFEIYPNGISTSLPLNVQQQFVQSIKGFENAWITRPGYAIEYDYFDPRDLTESLETKIIDGLFFAGQINGTTGYEEAAAQGIIAGINAAHRVQKKTAWSPRRDQAYIGVLINDLITNGTQEPYRMFTSRAEYRLLLREDNADQRLTPVAHEMGLIDQQRWGCFCKKQTAITSGMETLKAYCIQPDSPLAAALTPLLGQALTKPIFANELLRRPELKLSNLATLLDATMSDDAIVIEQIETQIKYAGYIARQQEEIDKQQRYHTLKLPKDINYDQVKGLSNELRQKLTTTKPETIAQAKQIAGMTPAAISLLLIYLKKQSGKNQAPT